MIRAFLLVLFFVASNLLSYSQEREKQLRSLVEAEIAFSDLAQASGFKKAFLANLAEGSVAFQRGEILDGRKAVEGWPDQDGPGAAIWYPVYADISSSLDMGFTTGPLTSYKVRGDSVPVNVAVFNSVWIKDSNGAWKVIADMAGSKYDVAKFPNRSALTTAAAGKESKLKGDAVKELASLKELEAKYNEGLSASRKGFDVNYVGPDVRLHHPRNGPVAGKEAASTFTDPGFEFSDYKLRDAGISKAADLAYSYGTLKLHIQGANARTLDVNYMRVWKKDSNGVWKLALDVVA